MIYSPSVQQLSEIAGSDRGDISCYRLGMSPLYDPILRSLSVNILNFQTDLVYLFNLAFLPIVLTDNRV